MVDFKDISLPKGCAFVELPCITDKRGMLAFGESMKNIPFTINRIFWTYNVSPNSLRGNHAHRKCYMVLFPLGGSYKIELDDGEVKKEIIMDRPNVGVLIPPLVWCKLYDFTTNAACVSLASDAYEPEDYIHDYDEFLKLTKK